MIILCAILFFGLLVYHANQLNSKSEFWIKNCLALAMGACIATVIYALKHHIGLVEQICVSLIFIAMASAAWPIKSDDDGGS